jgi:ACS family tartrate transporter-like MFS transporter
MGILGIVGPFFSLPSSFLQGTAAAGGIALINSIGVLGGFAGPFAIGVVREQTGGYETAMAMLAFVFVLSALIVLAVGRTFAARPVQAT